MKNIRPYIPTSDLLTDLSRNFDKIVSAFETFPIYVPNQLSTMPWVPKIDVKNEPNQYVVYADVPGIDPEKIEVNVDNGLLTLKGQQETEQKEEKENYLRIERSAGSFMRQITLPESIDTNGVVAKCNNGVLEVILPKIQKGSSRKIPVEGK